MSQTGGNGLQITRRSIQNSLLKIIEEDRKSRTSSKAASRRESRHINFLEEEEEIVPKPRASESSLESLSDLLTDEQVNQLKAAFQLYDKDGSGSISFEEFKEFLGPAASSEDVIAILSDGDTNGDGEVDFDEFKSMIVRQMAPNMVDDWIREAFVYMDSNADNVLSISELRAVLTESELGTLLGGDKNGDGKIDYEEFVEMMSTYQDKGELKLMI
mmetsp:Transcript_8223/g.10894  ORF Transcript_8223/g.10894 Transcript_8223/m.10894 type:complete len:216 (+) Transcript_8223:168-815(+)|eukprot:CAMPEP_0117759394 /NCGR_PEP_ID=MMETSP0947-20121206/15984_1 /TAXON_ID=44440 /ORGANISM="Chattonella subsalsa, Strain CCMP2191" /LENGTH=215 /DNA_ID=CAMNT_0005579837 /DNA_START=70 /DNA_END=717 /DNA_ORIENTATION=-